MARNASMVALALEAGLFAAFEHGGGVPAIRVNCPPELTLFELLPA